MSDLVVLMSAKLMLLQSLVSSRLTVCLRDPELPVKCRIWL